MKSRLKGCPRCGGDLFPDMMDEDGRTYACLQCGARVAATRRPAVVVPLAAAQRPLVTEKLREAVPAQA